jgi:hypothetical protein
VSASGEGLSPAEAVRGILEAFRSGDLVYIQNATAPAIVLRMPGKNALAGTYTGPGEVLALVARAAGRFIPATVRILGVGESGSEGKVDVEIAVRTPEGSETLKGSVFCRFDETGKVVESRVVADDQKRYDRLLR